MRVPARAMFAVAALALLLAAGLAVRSAAFLLGADRLVGEVVRVDARTFVEDEIVRTAYWPVIRYLGRDREPVEWNGPAVRDVATFGPGDRIALRRGAGEPPRIEIDEFSSLWSWPIVCVVLAWTFAGVGVVMRLVDAGGAHAALAAFLIVLGVPLALGGVARGAIDFAALRAGAWATGTIASPVGTADAAAGAASVSALGRPFARVRIVAADGRPVELVDVRRGVADFAPGARVEVLYPAGRPYAGRIYTPAAYWLATGILLGLGAALVAIGVALRRRAG